MPQFYRPGHARVPRAKVIEGPLRSSPRERGYDSRWDRTSKRFRRRHPFCAMCMEQDRPEFCDLVDHKFPVQDGGDVHCDEAGLWGLCTSHHGWKQALENYARETGQMSKIVMWCDEPESRPLLPGWELAGNASGVAQR